MSNWLASALQTVRERVKCRWFSDCRKFDFGKNILVARRLRVRPTRFNWIHDNSSNRHGNIRQSNKTGRSELIQVFLVRNKSFFFYFSSKISDLSLNRLVSTITGQEASKNDDEQNVQNSASFDRIKVSREEKKICRTFFFSENQQRKWSCSREILRHAKLSCFLLIVSTWRPPLKFLRFTQSILSIAKQNSII